MRPSQFFLQLIDLLLLLPSLRCLFKPVTRFTEGCLEIGNGFPLLCKDLGRSGDVGETSVVFFGELGKLGTAEEELWGRLSTVNRVSEGSVYFVLVCRSRCAEELSGSVCA
jgi:hypothetical protein